MSDRLLTMKISQWARENFCSYRKNSHCVATSLIEIEKIFIVFKVLLIFPRHFLLQEQKLTYGLQFNPVFPVIYVTFLSFNLKTHSDFWIGFRPPIPKSKWTSQFSITQPFKSGTGAGRRSGNKRICENSPPSWNNWRPGYLSIEKKHPYNL